MTICFEKDMLCVTVCGEMDHHNVKVMREKIDREIKSRPIKYLIFNLNMLDFMDSSGVGLVLGRYKLMKEIGGTVLIVCKKKSVKRVMEISGLNKIIPVFEDMAPAQRLALEVKK